MVQTKIPKSFLHLPHNSQGVPCFGRKICCSVLYQTERQAEIKPMPPGPLKGELVILDYFLLPFRGRGRHLIRVMPA
jgi:hypothetical protein